MCLCSELHLSASWSDLNEEIINDSLTGSSLYSMVAQRWTSRTVFKEKFVKDLVQSLEQLLALAKSSKYSNQVLGQFSNYQEERGKHELNVNTTCILRNI